MRPLSTEKAAFIAADGSAINPFDAVNCRYVDSKRSKLQEPLRYFSKELDQVVEIQAGTISDGRSVPWWTGIGYALYGGRNSPGAWVHDELYRTGVVSQEKADKVFREALLVEGERPSAAAAMYATLRAFGWYAYGKYRKQEKQSGGAPAPVDEAPFDHPSGG